MSEFWPFVSVITLWLALSSAAWWLYQRATGAGERRRISLAELAETKVAEAEAVFAAIRAGAPPGGGRSLLAETHALLKRIQEHGSFFDEVNGLQPRVARAIGEECEPLAEILHIRRDLWAASEILLVEDVHALGAGLAEEGEFEHLRTEARGLLFCERSARTGSKDLIALRLALAREAARKLVADIEEATRLAREHERLPTASEIIAYPVAAARALPAQIRSARAQLSAFFAQVRGLAVAIRNSETVALGLGEFARAREELPQRVKAGLDRASGAARQSAAGVKAHYDFLIAAHDFQAKYEDMLRKAPELSERGKQFIARLELAEKSERLKLTSATLQDAANRMMLRGLAHLIAGLQSLQTVLEPQPAERDSAPLREAPSWLPNPVRRPSAITDEEPSSRPQAPEEQRPAPAAKARPIPRAAFTLEGVKVAAFDGVVAWYKPAVAAVAAQKMVQDNPPAAPIGSVVLADPRRAADGTSGVAAECKPRRGFWSWLAGSRPPPIEPRAADRLVASGPLMQSGAASAPPPAEEHFVHPAKTAPDERSAAASRISRSETSLGRGKPSKPSLTAKLTDVAPVDLAREEPDNADDPELALAEDDDPGELTRSILESRAQGPERSGRASSRAFPRLRR